LLVDADVERPVQEAERLRELFRPARRRARGLVVVASACRQHPRDADDDPCGGPAPQQLDPRERLGHDASSTTNVLSGSQLRVTGSPSAAAPDDWTKTVSLPAVVFTTYCVATPVYARSSIVPAIEFAPKPSSRSCSGRPPLRT